ncbi:MAG: redoxin domain-containing protein [Spirochaetales bacterium]|nr:redoxin domain-containing protein [Spirochaetales bacterium]
MMRTVFATIAVLGAALALASCSNDKPADEAAATSGPDQSSQTSSPAPVEKEEPVAPAAQEAKAPQEQPAPKEEPVAKAPQESQQPAPAPAAAAPAATAVQDALWYADRFEQLGFYVFPTPEPIPPFTVKTMAGADTGAEALKGKVVLLNFWATWCPPCKAEMPSIEVLYKELKGGDFDIMAISVAEKKATVSDFLDANDYTYPMYLDETGAASAPFAGRGIPTTFVLDKQGRAIAGLIGSRSYDGDDVVSLFRELSERLP